MDIPRSEWQVRHRLTRLELVLDFAPGSDITLKAIGRAATTTRALWTLAESWGPSQGDLAPHDAIAHLALVVLQDHPNNIDRLNLALRGGSLWDEPELPW